jgi:hypothetical protein
LENLCIPAISCVPDGCFVHQQTTVWQGCSPVCFLQHFVAALSCSGDEAGAHISVPPVNDQPWSGNVLSHPGMGSLK